MNEIHQRLDNIRTILQGFKLEQEKIILNASDEYKFRVNSLPSRGINGTINNPVVNNHSLAKPLANDPTKQQIIESSINKIMGHESILMPMGTDVFTSQKIWPDALVAHYHHNIAKIGNIESHGSLWKLVHRKDNQVGYRVMLQASEIGEEPRYLASNLELSDIKADAAVWNLRIIDSAPTELTAVDVLNHEAKATNKGIAIALELVENNTFIGNEVPALTSISSGLPAPYCRLLTSCHSQITGISSLSIMSINEANKPDPVDPLLIRSYIWEIVPESSINEDMEFLERFLN